MSKLKAKAVAPVGSPADYTGDSPRGEHRTMAAADTPLAGVPAGATIAGRVISQEEEQWQISGNMYRLMAMTCRFS
jgi:hypothetical protein